MAVGIRHPEDLKRRIDWLLAAVALVYVGLIARIVYLQILHGDYYRARAFDSRSRTFMLQPDRGSLLDRDGKPIVITVHSGSVVCDPTKLNAKDRDGAAQALAEILQMDTASIRPRLDPVLRKDGSTDRHVVLAENLSPEQVEALEVRAATKLGRVLLAGIRTEPVAKRSCVTRSDTAQLAGLVADGKDGRPVGLCGLEKGLNSVLRGQDGRYKAELDPARRVIPNTVRDRIDPVNGWDVRLSIDTTIQHICQTELAAAIRANPARGATVIVMDPNTGDVLACVSYPTFDPMDRSTLKGNTQAEIDRAFVLFEPGSTLKTVTIAGALDEGIITPTDAFQCRGFLTVGNRTLRCVLHGASEKGGHGTLVAEGIIQHSCNVGAAQVGLRMGAERERANLDLFGLTSVTGLPTPADTRGRLEFGAVPPDMSQGKAARVAFGQSVVVTPMALTAAYCAIANGGILMKEREVLSYEDPATGRVRRFAPQAVRRVVKPQVAAQVRSFLTKVVTSGTGKAAAIPGYTVAGKTGTAQKTIAGVRGYAGGKYVASFLGMVPAQKPRLVITVVVDEPSGTYYGAQVAAPIFKSIGQRLMWYLHVPPDQPETLGKQLASAR